MHPFFLENDFIDSSPHPESCDLFQECTQDFLEKYILVPVWTCPAWLSKHCLRWGVNLQPCTGVTLGSPVTSVNLGFWGLWQHLAGKAPSACPAQSRYPGGLHKDQQEAVISACCHRWWFFCSFFSPHAQLKTTRAHWCYKLFAAR